MEEEMTNNVGVSLSQEEENLLNSVLEENFPTIPENSGSILVKEETSRFSGANWFENIQSKTVTLAGIGGIGSWCTLLLSRVHVNKLIIYDDDDVETVNMSGQLFGNNCIGNTKVLAISKMIDTYSNFKNIVCIPEKYTSESTATDIMICGFDSMHARQTFFKSWYDRMNDLDYTEEQKKKCLFIDGRLSADTLQVLCITGDDIRNIARYKNEFLFNNYEADATLCSFKQTSFMANMIASIMNNLFVNFCANELDGLLIDNYLPFFTQYESDTMYFKTEM